MPKQIDWIAIEQTYVTGLLSYKELSKAYGVGTSSVEGKAATGDWAAKRKTYRLAKESGDTPIKAEEVVSVSPASPVNLAPGQIDIKQILDSAISRYNEALSTLEPRSLERSTDALCRLLELRAKLYPQTLSALVEQILEFGHSPKELAEELRRQWRH